MPSNQSRWLKIQPIVTCEWCGKTTEVKANMTNGKCVLDAPKGWRSVWRGYGGWRWNCGCKKRQSIQG